MASRASTSASSRSSSSITARGSVHSLKISLPSKLVKEKSANSKCKAFVKASRLAAPEPVACFDETRTDDEEEPEDGSGSDLEHALGDFSGDESENSEIEILDDEEDDYDGGQPVRHRPASTSKKVKSSSQVSTPIIKQDVKTKVAVAGRTARTQWRQEMAEMKTEMAKVTTVVLALQRAIETTVQVGCACKGDKASSSADSRYAEAMAASSSVLIASSAQEYSELSGVTVSDDVLFTLEDARKALLQHKRITDKTLVELPFSTAIPPEFSTRTRNGEIVTKERMNKIRAVVREMCAILEDLPDKRKPEADGTVKTRGLQYHRYHYRTILAQVVDKIVTAVPELQLCEDNWKTYNLIARRLKSLAEKDDRREKLFVVKKEQDKVKKEREGEEANDDDEVALGSEIPDEVESVPSKGKAKEISSRKPRTTSKKNATTSEATTTIISDAARPKARQKKGINAANLDDIQNRLLANSVSTETTTNFHKPAPDPTTLPSGLTPTFNEVGIVSRHAHPGRAPSPSPSTHSYSRPLPSLGSLLQTAMKDPAHRPPGPFSRQQQPYDREQEQSQQSQPYGHSQAYHRPRDYDQHHSQLHQEPSYGHQEPSYGRIHSHTQGQEYGYNHHQAQGQRHHQNPYGLSPPPSHTQ